MELFNRFPIERIMAIFAHPDDAEAAAGGTLSSYASEGSKIHLLTIAKGEKGRGESNDRDGESIQASQILGISRSESLGYNDGEFDNDLELRKLLTEKIRTVKPQLVICPDPTAVFFSHAYVNHRDHRQTGWAVLDVVSSAVGNPKYFSTSPAHNVEHLLCAGSLEPNCVIDISSTIEQKVKAVQCYKSQIGERSDEVKISIMEAAQNVGREVGVKFGEAFRYCALGGVSEQV